MTTGCAALPISASLLQTGPNSAQSIVSFCERDHAAFLITWR